jgi:hypothetical protein
VSPLTGLAIEPGNIDLFEFIVADGHPGSLMHSVQSRTLCVQHQLTGGGSPRPQNLLTVVIPKRSAPGVKLPPRGPQSTHIDSALTLRGDDTMSTTLDDELMPHLLGPMDEEEEWDEDEEWDDEDDSEEEDWDYLEEDEEEDWDDDDDDWDDDDDDWDDDDY